MVELAFVCLGCLGQLAFFKQTLAVFKKLPVLRSRISLSSCILNKRYLPKQSLRCRVSVGKEALEGFSTSVFRQAAFSLVIYSTW